MPLDRTIEYCCCQLFLISHGVYLISLHCFLHAVYVAALVFTSYHRPKHELITYFTGGSHLCLIPVGVLAFWANLHESWKGARVSGVLMFIFAFANGILTGLYFSWFVHFKANSQLDKALFWENSDDWISSADLPFTFWHVLAFLPIPLNVVWFYYSSVMCRLGTILRAKKE